MPAGEAFTDRQSDEIMRAIRLAEQGSGLHVSVYVGELEGDSRGHAETLHERFGGDAPRAVLVAVDPGHRRVEIVTGAEARHQLDDRACSLATLSMTSAFAGGDLAGGIATGVQMLGDHATGPRMMNREIY